MVLLIAICIILILIPIIQKTLYTASVADIKIIVDTASYIPTKESYSHFNPQEEQSTTAQKHLPSKVPINAISEQDLFALGISKKIASNIIKYLEKGGQFRDKDALHKIYGMDQASYNVIIDNTIWPTQEISPKTTASSNPQTYSKTPSQTPHRFDINSVDSVELLNVRGIGNTLSQRIIKYRDKLGGFVNLDQLKEIYGISDFALEEVNARSFISGAFIPYKILINSTSMAELSKHPYIGPKKAHVIFNYSKNHNILSLDDLKKAYPFSEEELEKIKHYIRYE